MYLPGQKKSEPMTESYFYHTAIKNATAKGDVDKAAKLLDAERSPSIICLFHLYQQV